MANACVIKVMMVFAGILTLTDCLAPSAWPSLNMQGANVTGVLNGTLSETLAVGREVGTVKVNNIPSAYSILTQTYDGMFNITLDGDEGDIYLTNNTFLDYETATSVVVTILGSNGDGTGVATITINIADENDNAPLFGSSSTTVYITSSIANDTTIFTAAASDADSTVNNDVTYAIASGDDITNKFQIGSKIGVVTRTGETFTRSPYSLVITATDAGSPPLVGNTTLIVCIDCSGGVPVVLSTVVIILGVTLSRMLGTM